MDDAELWEFGVRTCRYVEDLLRSGTPEALGGLATEDLIFRSQRSLSGPLVSPGRDGLVTSAGSQMGLFTSYSTELVEIRGVTENVAVALVLQTRQDDDGNQSRVLFASRWDRGSMVEMVVFDDGHNPEEIAAAMDRLSDL